MEVTLAAFQKRYQYKAPADLIGKGGFSDVYKAWDTQDEQFVALKIATASADEKYDLTNEVKKIKKLKHPNLIEYYDLYEVSTGTKDIHGHDLNYQVAVMEYAEGGTLGDLLKNKPLTHTEAEELAEGIIDGLAYLHANNIAHRDLKPANILLTTKNGKRIPKITDFGLAKNTAAGNTASTMLVGTVEYMAPEFFKQAEGETTTAAADVWSIGVILLETLTGIHPFGKTTQGKNNEQIIYNILSADLNPSLQNLRAPFKELITRCLIREPKLRPQTAEELKGLLQSAPNDFSERTQIIDYKPQTKNVITPVPKWKKWGKALFDFDVRNGKWRMVLARELLLIVFSIPIILALRFVEFYGDNKHRLGKDLDYKTEYLYTTLNTINKDRAEDLGNWELVKPDSLFLHRGKKGELKFISKQDFFTKVNSDVERVKLYHSLAEFYKDRNYFLRNYIRFRKTYGEYKFEDLFSEYEHEIRSCNFDKQLTFIFFIVFGFRYFFGVILWSFKTLGITVPAISVSLFPSKQKKTIISIVALLLIVFASWIGFNYYKNCKIQKQDVLALQIKDSIAAAKALHRFKLKSTEEVNTKRKELEIAHNSEAKRDKHSNPIPNQTEPVEVANSIDVAFRIICKHLPCRTVVDLGITAGNDRYKEGTNYASVKYDGLELRISSSTAWGTQKEEVIDLTDVKEFYITAICYDSRGFENGNYPYATSIVSIVPIFFDFKNSLDAKFQICDVSYSDFVLLKKLFTKHKKEVYDHRYK